MINTRATFEKYSDEWLFSKVENKLHPCRDICAMLLLYNMMPSVRRMISAADHDIIWFNVNVDVMDNFAMDEDVLTLRRCGVFIDENDYLAMFV